MTRMILLLFLISPVIHCEEEPQPKSNQISLGECIDACITDFMRAMSSPSLLPSNAVNSKRTLKEEGEVVDEACDEIVSKLNCFDDCEDGDLIKEGLVDSPMVKLCVDDREKFKSAELKCVVENREEMLESCGGVKEISKTNAAFDRMADLFEGSFFDASILNNDKFKSDMDGICAGAFHTSECMQPVFVKRCPESLSNIGEVVSQQIKPKDLRKISPNCAKLADAVEGLSNETPKSELDSDRESELESLESERQSELESLESERESELESLESERESELESLESERESELEGLTSSELESLESEKSSLESERESEHDSHSNEHHAHAEVSAVASVTGCVVTILACFVVGF